MNSDLIFCKLRAINGFRVGGRMTIRSVSIGASIVAVYMTYLGIALLVEAAVGHGGREGTILRVGY